MAPLLLRVSPQRVLALLRGPLVLLQEPPERLVRPEPELLVRLELLRVPPEPEWPERLPVQMPALAMPSTPARCTVPSFLSCYPSVSWEPLSTDPR